MKPRLQLLGPFGCGGDIDWRKTIIGSPASPLSCQFNPFAHPPHVRFESKRQGKHTIDRFNRSGFAAFTTMDGMVVNLVDSGTGAMVWRGMASGVVDANASPRKHDKKIHEVVQKIFRSYPPKE